MPEFYCSRIRLSIIVALSWTISWLNWCCSYKMLICWIISVRNKIPLQFRELPPFRLRCIPTIRCFPSAVVSIIGDPLCIDTVLAVYFIIYSVDFVYSAEMMCNLPLSWSESLAESLSSYLLQYSSGNPLTISSESPPFSCSISLLLQNPNYDENEGIIS